MSQFVYYIPDKTSFTREEAKRSPASHAIEDSFAFREVYGGPDGGAGCVFGVSDERLGFYANRQTWRKLKPGETTYWVGMFKDDPPKPEDLMWQDALLGHWTELADGNKWLVPVARQASFDNGEIAGYACLLPKRSKFTDEGKWVEGEVSAEYDRLWNYAQKFAADWLAATVDEDAVSVELDTDTLYGGAVEALATNYRVSAVECDMLGLLTTSTVVAIMRAVIDYPTLMEWLKFNPLPPEPVSNS